MVEELQEVRTLILAHTYIYELFHKLFGGAPTEELIGALCSQHTSDAFDEFAVESLEMRRLCDLLESLRERDARELLDEVSGEYTRMLVGPTRPEAVPWESPYVSHENAFFQENTLVVREAYRRAGLQPKMLHHIPDDHVSLMCAFQAQLGERCLCDIGRDPGKLASTLRQAQLFLSNHMLTWLPDFAAAARRGRTALLYPQMAEALCEFSRIDAVFLGEAAYWAESHAASLEPQGAFGTEGFEAALEALRSIRLFGLEENELVAIELE